jgi:hypothetical protein
MPITCELVRISAPTMSTLPVNLTFLSTHLPGVPLPTTEFGRHFCFTKLGEQRPDRLNRCFLQVLLDGLDDRFALLCL